MIVRVMRKTNHVVRQNSRWEVLNHLLTKRVDRPGLVQALWTFAGGRIQLSGPVKSEY